MTRPEPNLSVKVDVTNPGEFFACCGLLELAHRLSPGAEGWFDAEEFLLRPPERKSTIALASLFDAACCAMCAVDKENLRSSPVQFGLPLDLYLDWYCQDNAPKTWAGQQETPTIVLALQDALRRHRAEVLRAPFDFAARVLKDAKKPISAFYFDARRFTTSRDVGFDTDEGEFAEHPAVELLALIGLQRFRPCPVAMEARTFRYATWPTPLPVPVACSVAATVVRGSDLRTFRFTLTCRDDGCRLKAFSFSATEKEHEHE